jgi:hypothetical protein
VFAPSEPVTRWLEDVGCGAAGVGLGVGRLSLLSHPTTTTEVTIARTNRFIFHPLLNLERRYAVQDSSHAFLIVLSPDKATFPLRTGHGVGTARRRKKRNKNVIQRAYARDLTREIDIFAS